MLKSKVPAATRFISGFLIFAAMGQQVFGQEAPVRSLRRISAAPSIPSATTNVSQKMLRSDDEPNLPPAPDGTVDLRFSEFFKPIGSRGMEYTEKLKSLNGKRVRLWGHMVKQEVPKPGLFLLARIPVKLEEDELGLADDLPAAVVHVLMPVGSGSPQYFHGRLLLTGKLSLGTREETDGRLSCVRLTLEEPIVRLPGISTTTAPTTKPVP